MIKDQILKRLEEAGKSGLAFWQIEKLFPEDERVYINLWQLTREGSVRRSVETRKNPETNKRAGSSVYRLSVYTDKRDEAILPRLKNAKKRISEALFEAGARGIDSGDLRSKLGDIPPTTLWPTVTRMKSQGLVTRSEDGVYRWNSSDPNEKVVTRPKPVVPKDTTTRIIRNLLASEPDGLTGWEIAEKLKDYNFRKVANGITRARMPFKNVRVIYEGGKYFLKPLTYQSPEDGVRQERTRQSISGTIRQVLGDSPPVPQDRFIQKCKHLNFLSFMLTLNKMIVTEQIIETPQGFSLKTPS